MIGKLINALRGAKKTYDLNDLLSLLDSTSSTLKGDVVPSLDILRKVYIENGNTFDLAPKLERINKYSDLDAKTPAAMCKELTDIINDVLKEISELKKLSEDNFDNIITKAMNARQAAIVYTISSINSFALYSMDIILYSAEELIEATVDGYEIDNEIYGKERLRYLNDGILTFSSQIKSFEDVEDIVKSLSKVATIEVVDDDSISDMLDKRIKKSGSSPKLPKSGFSGSPIYSIRMWLVDKDIEKYKVQKQKKELLELKLLELKSLQGDEHNEKLSKQISFYEDEISKLEYSIATYED